MYFTRWNPFCQIISAENAQDLRKFAWHPQEQSIRKQAGGSDGISAEPPD